MGGDLRGVKKSAKAGVGVLKGRQKFPLRQERIVRLKYSQGVCMW